MALRGYVYTIAVDVYAYRLAISSILPCVQHQNALRLAAFYLAFSTKTHCVQRQNALCLAPKCSIFSTKQPEIQCKLRFFEINIHFAGIYSCPLFASKPTFARIDFLRQGWRLVEKKPLIMLKFMPKSGQQLGRNLMLGETFGLVCWRVLVVLGFLVILGFLGILVNLGLLVFQLFQDFQLFQGFQGFQVFQLYQAFQFFQLYQPKSFIRRRSHLFTLSPFHPFTFKSHLFTFSPFHLFTFKSISLW